MPASVPASLATLFLLLLPLPAAAQTPRCPPGRFPVELRQGPGTPMVLYRVRVTRRCMTRAQIDRMRGPYACHPPGRQGAVVCVALVPRMRPGPTPPPGVR